MYAHSCAGHGCRRIGPYTEELKNDEKQVDIAQAQEEHTEKNKGPKSEDDEKEKEQPSCSAANFSASSRDYSVECRRGFQDGATTGRCTWCGGGCRRCWGYACLT